MKKVVIYIYFLLGMIGCLSIGTKAYARAERTIQPGVYAGDIDLGGMTIGEAEAAVNAYIASLEKKAIVMYTVDDQEVLVTVKDFGIYWSNPQIVREAILLGYQGNIVQRYKEKQDIKHERKIYPLLIDFDQNKINSVLREQCTLYDRTAKDFGLVRKEGSFTVLDGQDGCALDVEASLQTIYTYLMDSWNKEDCDIRLNVKTIPCRGSREELLSLTDVLGTFTTSYTSSGANRSANIANGARLINGTLLYPGDQFSMIQKVTPFSQKNGYYMAGSYLNGQVVDSLGGGICQVSTTLYNAVLRAELEVTQRHNHSMIVNYVDPSADAAIAESAEKDFCFKNNREYPVYVEAYHQDKRVTFNVYGVETRQSNRTVEYISEIIEKKSPTNDVIHADASQPLGAIQTSSAHVGYKARLWKVVKENGVEISREAINSSTYKMVPRTATVGVSTADANAYNQIMEAINTASIDHVRNVIAALTNPAPPQPE